MLRSVGIYGVDEDALGEGFAQPVVVVVGGVDAGQGVVAEGLERKLTCHCETL